MGRSLDAALAQVSDHLSTQRHDIGNQKTPALRNFFGGERPIVKACSHFRSFDFSSFREPAA